jgi:hypothetical protein
MMNRGRPGDVDRPRVRDLPGYSDDTVPSPYQNRTESQRSWLNPVHGDDTYGGQSALDPAYRAMLKSRTDLARRNTDTYDSMGRSGGSLESRDASLEAMGMPDRDEMARRHGSYGKYTKQRGGRGGHIDTTGLGGRMANLSHMRANQGPALQQRAARKQQEREQLDADVQAGRDRGRKRRVDHLRRTTGISSLSPTSTAAELRDADTVWRLQNEGRKRRRRTQGAISNSAAKLVARGYSPADAMRTAQNQHSGGVDPPPRMSDSRAHSNTQRKVTDLDRQIRQARSPRHKAYLRGQQRIAQRRLDRLNDQERQRPRRERPRRERPRREPSVSQAMADGRKPVADPGDGFAGPGTEERIGSQPTTRLQQQMDAGRMHNPRTPLPKGHAGAMPPSQPAPYQSGAMGWPGGPTALPGDPKQTPPAKEPTSPPPPPTPKDIPKETSTPGKQHPGGMMERYPSGGDPVSGRQPAKPPARPSTGGDNLPPPVPTAPPTGAGSSPKLPPRAQAGPKGGPAAGRGGIFNTPSSGQEPFEGPQPLKIKPRPQGVVGPKKK